MRSRFITIGVFTVLVSWSGLPVVASAGGYEFPGGDARALGRGSTGFARADDPIMAFLNPAALGSMPNQLVLGNDLIFQKSCVDRTGTYDPGYVGGQTNVEHPEVCTGKDIPDRMTLLPLIAFSVRFGKRVAMLLGLDAPYATRRMLWEEGPRIDEDGREQPGFYPAPDGVTTPDGLVPSPLRYLLVKDDVILLHVTYGIGVKLTDWLQIGAGFGWGFSKVRFTNYTRFLQEGEDPAGDQPTTATVTDWFVPRVIGSIHFIPHDRVDIVFGVRWDDDVKASGNTVAQTPLGEGRSSVSYTAQRPMWFNFGIRYAHRTAPRSSLDDGDATDDPMKNETFDIEANVIYERNSVVTDALFLSGDISIFTNPDDPEPSTVIPAFENPIRVPHHWKDQVSVRVGGDWNVIPGQLALRLGGSYETLGFRDGFAFIDYLPLQRFGVHVGLSGRFGRTELTLGYAHFFTSTYNEPNGQHPQIVIGLDGPVDGVTTFTNSGTYKTHVDVLGWSLRVVFK
ncbi:MAG: hypothetical protein OEQ49_11710 [Myxococcales bacterium]|nr:hypothetical protein [Myxococcales bacterium]